MKTHLCRSRTDTMLAGVCGGFAAYFRIDSTLVRLIFILFTIGSGVGVLIYLACWLIMPLEEAGAITNTQIPLNDASKTEVPVSQGALLIGGALILLGAAFLLRNMGVGWMGWMHLRMIWPIILIGIGTVLLLRHTRAR